MNRRRILVVVGAVVLAMLGVIVILAYVRSAEQRALEGTEIVPVLVATEEIDANTPADQLGGRVTTQEVPARLRQDDAVRSLGNLRNQVTVSPIRAGEQIVARQFGRSEEVLSDGGAAQIEEGQEIVSIALEPQRAVGGRLSAGDRVSVIVSTDEANVADENNPGQSQRQQNVTGVVLSDVLVTAVGGGVTEESGEAANAVTVSLQVRGSDAERIVFGMEHGTVWLTLNGEGADAPDDQARTPENIFDVPAGAGT